MARSAGLAGDDGAEEAEDTAASQLKAAAAKIRRETAAAEDPSFQAAGKVSASKPESSAADRRYLDKVKSLADLEKTVQSQFAEWLTPSRATAADGDRSPGPVW